MALPIGPRGFSHRLRATRRTPSTLESTTAALNQSHSAPARAGEMASPAASPAAAKLDRPQRIIEPANAPLSSPSGRGIGGGSGRFAGLESVHSNALA